MSSLHAGTFSDVVGFAADPFSHDEVRGRAPALLVLVDASELAWQRAKYRGNQHLLLPTDPVLVSAGGHRRVLMLVGKSAR